ncbi:hypothetical protein AB0469_36265 [Streptomyces sp. NPDC093801]|uniref:hypothetical protein n=1 Tax=Streptomyces sp. NPDC093801 TaxID=3155203 RepID=UPI0034502C6C
MGFLDQAALQQAKKSQGETNDRLDALLAEQQQTNALLTQLISLVAPPPIQPPQTPGWAWNQSWSAARKAPRQTRRPHHRRRGLPASPRYESPPQGEVPQLPMAEQAAPALSVR